MSRPRNDIKIRIEQQELRIEEIQENLKEAQDLYNALIQEREDMANKEILFEAFKAGNRDLQEIIDYINSGHKG